jgi:CheY-like chemotaxis protein
MRPVLVVEDDRKIARVVALYLEEAGYRVIVAESGRKALDSAAKETPSVGGPLRHFCDVLSGVRDCVESLGQQASSHTASRAAVRSRSIHPRSLVREPVRRGAASTTASTWI